MYNIFGFYKFKKITNLKKKKKILDNYLKQENFRGTIILSPEGVNGTISFKIDRYINSKSKKININLLRLGLPFRKFTKEYLKFPIIIN